MLDSLFNYISIYIVHVSIVTIYLLTGFVSFFVTFHQSIVIMVA